MDDAKLNRIWKLLRIGLGAIALIAGLDKFFNVLTYWPGYVAGPFAKFMPFSTQTFMYIVGVVESFVGIAILTKFTRIGAYVMTVWLLLIAVDLIAARAFDVAARDIGMALATFSLAQLTEVLHGVPAKREVPAVQRPAHAAT